MYLFYYLFCHPPVKLNYQAQEAKQDLLVFTHQFSERNSLKLCIHVELSCPSDNQA